MTNEPLVLSVQELADSFGVSIHVIYRDIKAGNIPARKIGGKLVISRAWRDRFVASLDPESQAVAVAS